jgi:hypothetical protein
VSEVELERELRSLRVEWPETPDLAGAVVGRLPAGAPRRRWVRWVDWPAWQVAVAVGAVLVAVVMAVPPARSAVLDLLGFGSVKIERGEPRPSEFGSDLSLGEPVTLSAARRRAGFPVLVPAAVGRPDAVYVDAGPPPRVDLVYRSRPGLQGSAGVGLLVTEFRAMATPLIEKTIGSATDIERLTVGGDPAFFITGADHGFAYMSEDGQATFETQRLAGPTLLVERDDGILLRVEGELTQEEAVRIAQSVR